MKNPYIYIPFSQIPGNNAHSSISPPPGDVPAPFEQSFSYNAVPLAGQGVHVFPSLLPQAPPIEQQQTECVMLIAITPSHLSATNFEKHAFTVVSTHCVLS
jgi:hypothetical protein